MSDTKCRLSTCDWSGSVDEIFTHVETYHRSCFISYNGKNYYDFTLDDLPREAYLLSGPEGLYWFCLNPNENQKAKNGDDMLSRGVFHIGDSEPVQYTLKIGQIRDAHAEYLGVFTSQEENLAGEEKYELEFPFSFIEFLNTVAPSRKMRLYFGDYDDSDDIYWPDPDEIYWSERELEINSLCVELLTCAICFEFIRDNARFCENKHFICLDCFNKMQEKRLKKCPTCRGDYLVDCFDERINAFLKMVKFPTGDERSPPKRLTLSERFTPKKQEKPESDSLQARSYISDTEASGMECTATEVRRTSEMTLAKRFELHHLEKLKTGPAATKLLQQPEGISTEPKPTKHMTISERFKLQNLEKAETEAAKEGQSSSETEAAKEALGPSSQETEDTTTESKLREQMALSKLQHLESESPQVGPSSSLTKKAHQTDDAVTEPRPSKRLKF